MLPRAAMSDKLNMNQLLSQPLLEVRDCAVALRNKLTEAKAHELPAFRPFLDEQIQVLDDTLRLAKVPDHYRVAIVGRFKVGKSSFVNKITDEKLAGVETSPETAAISLFRYADETYAEIKFICRDEWQDLKIAYKENPDDPEAKRYSGFSRINDRPPRKDKEGRETPRPKFDLAGLEAKWLRTGGYTHTIKADNWKTKEGKNRFRREIKQFTSSQEPLHYLVDRLIIYSPIPLLGDNIELIDTPGLDDTERFRVRLTESIVKEVDAILFLTLAGASYSQQDKDFIVRQLRQRQIKHLQIIATKVDDTFEAAIRTAKDNDDPVPSFEEFRHKEESRIRHEVRKTLDELLASNQLSDEDGYYFLEQLDSVPIHLISTHYYDDQKFEMAGIAEVRKKLYEVLSTSQRFEYSRKILTERLGTVVTRLTGAFSGRLNAIEADYNPDKVRAEIDKLRIALQEKLDFFGPEAATLVAAMENEQKAIGSMLPTHLDNICLVAESVFHEFEKNDLGNHWRSKRYGGWGYLSDLQSKVADLVFPKVETLLNHYIEHFRKFSGAIATHLGHLENEVKLVEESNALSGLEPLTLAQAHQKVLGEFEKLLVDHVTRERDSILFQLEGFVSQEVETRIGDAKAKVTEVWGTGTTWRQNSLVKDFYGTVRKLLSSALRGHLEKHFADFAAGLITQAKSVHPQIDVELMTRLDERLKAIQSTIAIASTEEKERIIKFLSALLAELQSAKEQPTVPVTASVSKQPDTELRPISYEILDGATGFGYEKIFRPYMSGAESILVEDPYIRYRHQLDNFQRFCGLAVSVGAVRKITLKTGADFGEDLDEANGRLENLKRDLAQNHRVQLEWNRSETLHDREVIFSNGWTVKVGRGLDIYYKPESWASVGAVDFNLRRCRQTKVDVLRRET
jgi:signal recognition particle receptor subunit beta